MPFPFLTIFTPTFNREHTLPKLYESLKNQTSKDFEWVIVDDGSTDGSENLINEYIQENKLKIRYCKQKNQGKHIAYNTGLDFVNTPFVVTVDSDDYLIENAVSVIKKLSQKIVNKSDFAGFTFIRFSDAVDFDKEKYGKKEWIELNAYQWEHKGEMSFVFKSEIAKKFLFPVFEEEKFCQEAVVILRILQKNKVLFTDHVLAKGDYLEDGLSQNLYKRLLANPRYAMVSFSEKLKFSKSKSEKAELAKSYWDIARKSKPKISFWTMVSQIPIYYTFGELIRKLRK